MPKELYIALIALVLATWFLIGERKTTTEKVSAILAFVILYLFYRFLNGDSIKDIMTSIQQLLS